MVGYLRRSRTVNDPRTISELVVELTRTIARYMRQEVGRSFQESVAAPLDALRRRMVYTITAAFAFGAALVFASIGLFLLIEMAVGTRWAAMLIVAILFAAAGWFLFRKGMRSGQRKELARRDTSGHPVPGGTDQGQSGVTDQNQTGA